VSKPINNDGDIPLAGIAQPDCLLVRKKDFAKSHELSASPQPP